MLSQAVDTASRLAQLTYGGRQLKKGPSAQGIVNTVSSYAKAYEIYDMAKKNGHQPGVVDTAFMAVLPKYYSAFNVAKASGDQQSFLGKIASVLFPERYTAYKLAKARDGKVSLIDLAGIILAPNEYGALRSVQLNHGESIQGLLKSTQGGASKGLPSFSRTVGKVDSPELNVPETPAQPLISLLFDGVLPEGIPGMGRSFNGKGVGDFLNALI